MGRDSSLTLCGIAYFALGLAFARAVSIRRSGTIVIGSTVSGTTRGQISQLQWEQGTISPQAFHDFRWQNQGRDGSGSIQPADIRFTTCLPPGQENFDLRDPVLHVFDSLEVLNSSNAAVLPLAESGPDCGTGHGTLEFRAAPDKEYLLAVSSSSGHSGRYRVSSTVLSSRPTPTPLPWGLDRIDQRSLPLDGKFSVMPLNARAVYVYVIDSGVRTSHKEFERADGSVSALHGLDTVERRSHAKDCTGHGTHVAAIVAGKSFGVARDATIVSVRVTACDGTGKVTRLLEGLEFVMEDSKTMKRRPALVSMSLSTKRSAAINFAVRKLHNSGIPVVVSAGNEDDDSCNFSPSSEKAAITVAGSRKDDSRPVFSNSGECVDVFAPGESITSAWHTGDHASKIMTGTSFACPHVAGAVAVLLSANPRLQASAVSNMIYSASTLETVSNHSGDEGPTVATDHSGGFNNRLLYVRPVPLLGSKERPRKRFMSIYAVLEIGQTGSECLSRGIGADVLPKNILSDLQVNSRDVELWRCCPRGDLRESKCGKLGSRPRIRLGIEVKERIASSTFVKIEDLFRNSAFVGVLRKSLDVSSLSVAIEPWVVDSDGNIFWAAPDLRGDATEMFTLGAKVAALSCSAAIIPALVIAILVCKRRREANMELSALRADILAEKEVNAANDVIHPLNFYGGALSPRQAMARENTALPKDIVESLSIPRSSSVTRDGVSQSNMAASWSLSSWGLHFPQHRPQRDASAGRTPVSRQGARMGASILNLSPAQGGIAATPTTAPSDQDGHQHAGRWRRFSHHGAIGQGMVQSSSGEFEARPPFTEQSQREN